MKKILIPPGSVMLELITLSLEIQRNLFEGKKGRAQSGPR